MKKDRKINFKKLTQINQHVKPQPLKTHRSLLEALERRDVIGSLLPFFPGGGLTPSVAKSLNMSMSQAFARLNMGEQKIVADAFETLSAALRDSDVPSPLPPTADDSSAAGSTQSVSSSWDGLSSQGDYVANLASAEDVAIDLSVDLQAESLNFSTDRVANLPSLNSLSSLKGTSVSMQKTPASPTFSAVGNGAPNLDGVRPTPLQTQGSQGNFNSSYQDSSETAAETDQSTAFSNGGSLKNAAAPVAETPNAGAEPSSNAADADAPRANTEKVAFAYDLSDWTVSESGGSEQGRGSVTPIAQGALMAEGDSFVVEMRKTFVMTGEVDALSFAYEASFDATSTGLVKDAFEAALVDSEGYSLVKTFNRSRDSFFNLTEGLDPALGSQTTLSDESGLTRVTLDISSVPVGTECNLVFRLVNNDADAGGWVKIFTEKGQSGGAPEIMPFEVAETVEGAVVSLSADFIDSDAGEAHVATIDWGDGTVEAVAVVPTETGGTVSGEHIYADNGQYEATVSVIDAAGMGAACSTTVAVANAAPEMTDITTSFDGKMNANGTVDQYVVLAGTFTDPGFTNAAAGTEETFVLSVDWGDGTVEEYEPDVTQGGPGVLTVGEYSLRHSYRQGGIYTAVVTVRDDDGGEDAKESKFGYGEIEICLATTYPVVKPSRVKIPVNPSIRHGEIPVIVKSVGNLDATALNVSSVRFYPGDASDSNSQLIAADVDPFADGIADAIFHFSTTDAFIRPTDKIGWLTANFDDGTPFFGFDTIKATPISGAVSEAYDPRTAADSNTRFFVLDGEQDAVYRYTAEGRENSDFVLSDATPDVRDVTANVDGSKLWIVDGISRSVQTRSPDGWLLGAWRAVDVYSPQGIATNGTDIWIIDNLLHGVMRYDGAANLSEGNRTADAFFSLDADNIAPTGMATDGEKIWVSDSYADKIFVYDAFAGNLLGSWSLAPENGFAAGVTNDPTGESDSIWVVDSETLNVYEYAAAAALLTGSAVLAGTFALAEGNTRPVGIVDPAVTTVTSPQNGEKLDVDSTFVVSGSAVSDTQGEQIVAVYVNGTAVDALDVAGNFFAAAQVNPGENTYEIKTVDSNGNVDVTTASVYGVSEAERLSELKFDVSPSFKPDYARTSFDDRLGVLYAQLAIENVGQYAADAPFYVGVRNISDMNVVALDPVGVTKDGIPYYDVSEAIQGGALNPNDKTLWVDISFLNPGRNRFTYELVYVYKTNEAPVFVTAPGVEAYPDKAYSYASRATDPNRDPLTYSLVVGPDGMTVDAKTGDVAWTPTDLGVYSVVLRVEDGRGGSATQTYAINVVEAPENRPPVITSYPPTSATVVNYKQVPGGKIVVAADEWTLSDDGFWNDYEDTATFVENVARWFTDGETGNFLALSENFGLRGGALANVMISNGHQWTGTTETPTLEELLEYDGVFLGGNTVPDNQLLIDYVNAGGCVYLCGGTYNVNETRDWGVFLEAFGLGFYGRINPDGDAWNHIYGVIPIDAKPHPIFENVSALYQRDGHDIVDLDESDSKGVFVATINGMGQYAVYDSAFDVAEAGSGYVYQVEAYEPDGDTVTYSLGLSPEGMWINPNNGAISWAPTVDQIGENVVTVIATDEHGATDTQTYSIMVYADPNNHDPIIISEPTTVIVSNQTEICDLSDWRQIVYESDDYAPNWVLSNNNTTASQEVNAKPSILLSDFNVLNREISGSWKTTDSDDDFMGFVFGYQDEGHFYLFDWKGEEQDWKDWGVAEKGMSVKRVNTDGTIAGAELWNTNGNDSVTTLYHNSIGWERNVEYTFSLVFKNDEFMITVSQGDVILDVITLTDDAYEDGKFGFYNFSQAKVYYNGFYQKDLDYNYTVVAVDPDDDDITYELLYGPENSSINPQTGELTWITELGSYNFTVLASDGLGGTDVQSFVVNVTGGGTSEVAGTVYEDVNRNGRRDTTLVPGDNPLVVFVVDTSGSMEYEYSGTHVGDLNNDGMDSRIDAVIYALEQYQRQLIDFGMGSGAELALIDFSGSVRTNDLNPVDPGVQTFVAANADADKNGVPDFVEAVRNLVTPYWDGTNYEQALTRSISVIREKGEPNRETLVIFVTDGIPNSGDDGSVQAQQLRDMGVLVYGIGVGSGGDYSIDGLRNVDPNGIWLDNMNDLTNLFSGMDGEYVQFSEQGIAGITVYADLNHNGIYDSNEPSAITDSDGKYAITGLPSGDFVVRVDVPANGVQTQPTVGTGYNVALGEGQSFETDPFGLYYLGDGDSGALTIVSTPPNTATVGEVYRYDVQTINPSGSVLDFTLLSAPSGMGIHHDLGTIVWRPTNADVGEYQAVVKVRNANGEVATQAFTVAVEAANHAPVITTDAIPTPVLAASPYRAYIYAQDADNDALTYSLVGAPNGMTIDPDTGVLDWTPEAALIGSTVAATVVVTDARGKSAKKTYNLAVVETLDNDAPVITSTPRTRTRMELPYVYLVQAYDPNGDRLTFSVSGTSADGTPLDGITCDSDTGLIQWTPSAADQGTATVAVSVSDGRGGVATQTYALDIITLAENTAPRIISTPARTGIVGKAWRYNAEAVDVDGDFVYWRLKDAPDGASINIETGEIVWVPTYQQLAANLFTVVCTDIYGASTEQTFTVTVRGINRPPVIFSAPNSAAATEYPYVYAVRAKDADGDELRFSLVDGAYPEGMTIDESLGLVRWTPSAADAGLHFVTIQVDDGVGGIDTQTYSINVIDSALNNPPVITSTPTVAASVGLKYSYRVVAKDPEGDKVTYALEEGPDSAIFNASTGQFEWSPAESDIGNVRIVFTATDVYGKRAVQSYTLTIAPNQAPTIVSTPPTSAVPDAPYSYDVQASDPEGDAITYALVQGPEGMTVDEYGRLRWTPAASFMNVNVSVTVAAIDSYSNVAEQRFTVSVGEDVDAPQVRLICDRSVVKPGEEFTVQVQAIDNVGVASVSLMVNGVEQPLVWNAKSQLYTAQLQFANVGEYEVYATAADAAGNVGQSDVAALRASEHAELPQVTFHAIYPQVYNDEVGGLVDGEPIVGDDILWSPVITYLTDVDLSIFDDNMGSWIIDFAPVSAVDLSNIDQHSDAYRVLEEGSGVLNHHRVRIDPTILANDAYILRVQAYRTNGIGWVTGFVFGVEGAAKLGQFAFSTTDMSISRNGISLVVQRAYDTARANEQGDFGYGWSLSICDPKIAETTQPGTEMVDGDRVYITTPDGDRIGFTYKPDMKMTSGMLAATLETTPRFEADPGVEWSLACLETPPIKGAGLAEAFLSIANAMSDDKGIFNPSNYVLTSKDGTAYYYKQKEVQSKRVDEESGLYKIVDPNGIELTVTKDGIKHSAGGFLTFERDARGRITSITDHMDMTVTYKYDASGDLVAFSNQIDSQSNEASITYKYRKTPAHFLDEAYDKNGGRVFKAEFDEDGRLVGMTDALGNVTQQEFDPGAMNGITRDANGNVTTIWYDERGNVTLEEKPVTNVLTGETVVYTKTYDYGDERFPDKETRVVDYNGTVTEYVYDDAGNQTRISITSPDGTTSVYSDKTYDGKGNVTSETLPGTGTLAYAYDEAGNTTAMTVGDSVVNSAYNDDGKETSSTDANGNVTRMEYPEVCPCNAPRKLIWGDGTYEMRYWNHHGAITRVEYYEADGTLTKYVETSYDDLDRKTTEISGQGNARYAVAYEYDGDSDRVAVEKVYNVDNPSENDTTYSYYDKVGNLVRKVDPGLNPTDPNAGVFYKYDGNGNVVWQRDAIGNVTTWIYDSMNRVAEERDSLYWAEKNVDWSSMTDKEILALISTPTPVAVSGVYAPSHTIRYAYDAADHIVEKVDQNGRRISYSYDYLGNKTTETWHDETDDVTPIYVVTYGYDENGRMTSAVSPDAEYALTYNDMGYLKTLSVDYPWSANFETFTISYEYDAMGNVVSQTDSTGLTVRSEYNARNMLSSRWWEGAGVDGIRVDFTYNVLGYITSVTRWADTARTVKAGTSEYTYDLAGRATGITHKDALGKVLADYDYEYDFANRLIEEALSSVVDGASRTAFYDYDELGQLISAMYDNGQANETFAWDANGNSKAPGAVIGAGNRLLSDGTFNYQYDFAGNMIAKTRINPVAGEANYFEYKYDYNNRLVAVDEYSSKGGVLLHTETYRHDMFGRRVQVVSDGTETISTFDGIGELANEWARFDAAGNVIQRFLFGAGVDRLIAQWTPDQGVLWALTDRLGSVRDLMNNAGAIQAHMNYTAFGSPILTAPNAGFAKYLASHPFAFTGRTWDSLANMSYFRARTFDPMTGHFTSADPLRFEAGDMNLYRYLANSPFMGTDPSGKIGLMGCLMISIYAISALVAVHTFYCEYKYNHQSIIVSFEVAAFSAIGTFIVLLGALISIIEGSWLMLVASLSVYIGKGLTIGQASLLTMFPEENSFIELSCRSSIQ